MLRIVCCVCVVVLLVSCNKNYRRLHIEKRVYRDGYYVHVPWERRTPVNAYPKPQPYPVDHSRTAKTDTTQKNAGGYPVPTSQSTNANRIGDGNGGGSNANTPVPPPNGNGGMGSPVPVATYYPAPPLQYEPDRGSPPLQRPSTVPPTTPSPLPPDSSVGVNDSLPASEPKKDRSIDFPDGEVSFVAELGFYNPLFIEGTEIKPLSYNAGVAARYSIHPWSRHKIAAEAGVFISQHFIQQDQHKAKPMFQEAYDHERLMQFKTRFMIADRIYVSRSPDAKVDAIELGAFSDIGFFSTHVAINNTKNTENAAFSRDKSRLFGLHYLRRVQFGMTARVANEMWSVFANYRFNTMVKAGPDGGDLPKLVVGATFTFGE